MKRAQLLGIGIAGACGLGAFFGVMSLVNKPTKVVREEVTTDTTQVLVAKVDLPLGTIVGPESFRWQDWPQSAVNASYVQRATKPNALKDLAGSVARAPMLPGEPVTAHKLVRAGDGGVLAAVLTPGMRAISIRIKEETGVSRLILPNDHVDVISTQRRRGRSGGEEFTSDVLFRNVRVLSIGQLIEARDGKKLAEGNTAALELTEQQATALAQSSSQGEITLALRSIADISSESQEPDVRDKRAGSVKVLRYGVKTRAYGVN